jgi:REP element-mobilizing transposase RayT
MRRIFALFRDIIELPFVYMSEVSMRRDRQSSFPFPESRGGSRKGAGRKPSTSRSRVAHRKREELNPRHPVHVTLRLVRNLPTLREGRAHRAFLDALAAGADRLGLRVLHYSAQSNHVHLVCEAIDERALARGMKGVCVRIARALNRLWKRKGSLFDDRYHFRALTSPRAVRNVLVYVLQNAHRHGMRLFCGIDPYSSASWFAGWKRRSAAFEAVMRWCPFPRARTWLLSEGWTLHGLLEPIAS